jgi:DNA-binding XRE family transcriptional regulator
MTDVIKIAREHRARLAVEIAKMDDFIRMAEALIQYDQGLNRAPVMPADRPASRVLLADRGHDADRVGEDPKARGGAAAAIEKTAAVGNRVVDTSLQPDPARNKEGASAINVIQVDSDHFAFNDKALPSQDELVLINPLTNGPSQVDVHVGQRMRQRRWMMGITQQQLGDLVGVKLEQIQKYETGKLHIRARRMWDVAVAMEVPMSYFFEGIEGPVADTKKVRGDTLTGEEAPAPVSGAPHARTARAS